MKERAWPVWTAYLFLGILIGFITGYVWGATVTWRTLHPLIDQQVSPGREEATERSGDE